MNSSVVWATVIGLLLGCVIGVAAMGSLLLPVQFKLEEEKAALKEETLMLELERNDAQAKAENAEALQHKAEGTAIQLRKEKKDWELRYNEAVQKLGEAQRKLQAKP
jgi:hypothetical protein